MYRGSKKHLDYMNEWSKEHTRAFTVKFNVVQDKDIINKLKSVNKTDYLRQLIRADIEGTRQ